jgi:hypothetical protein
MLEPESTPVCEHYMEKSMAVAGDWGSAPTAVESDLSSASSNGKESLQSLCAILYLSCSVSEQAGR